MNQDGKKFLFNYTKVVNKILSSSSSFIIIVCLFRKEVYAKYKTEPKPEFVTKSIEMGLR
ncbi:hypothetical protein BLOT_002965 [Blomia tropicalis]|nr:hypothetical protein BLOT_002965 [Blomia tropicalis]